MKSLSVTRTTPSLSDGVSRRPRPGGRALALCAALAGTLVSAGGARAASFGNQQLVVGLSPALRLLQSRQILLADLKGELTTITRFIGPESLGFLRLICTVRNQGTRGTGPFVTVISGQFTNGLPFSQSVTMTIPAGGALSVELPAGFALGGTSLAWARCSVDDTRVVPEFSETNNVTTLDLQPIFGQP
jgi:hypothetical protein